MQPETHTTTSTPLSLTALRDANSRRAVEWSKPTNGIEELLFRSNELGGEAGEAQNAVKKYARFLLGVKGGVDEASSVANIREELADVVICADRVAEYIGADLGPAIRDKFNMTSRKYGLSVEITDETSGVDLIAEERQRQIDAGEVYDDQFKKAELTDAAAAYIYAGDTAQGLSVSDDVVGLGVSKEEGPQFDADCAEDLYPFKNGSWKPDPNNPIANYARAGAFIAAEIDRLLRLKAKAV